MINSNSIDTVTVVSLHSQSQETVEDDNGVTVFRLPLDNFYWPFDPSNRRTTLLRAAWHARDAWNRRGAARFGAVLDRVRPDLLHTNNVTGFSVSIWRAARLRRIPVVHTLRDYSLLCSRGSLFKNGATCETRCVSCRILTETSKLESQKVDRVVSVSNHVLATHRKYGYFKNVAGRAIPNFGDGKLDRSDLSPRDQTKPLTFGFLGKIHVEKGIEVLLQASQTLDRTVDWRLLIGGEGEPSYLSMLRSRYSDPRVEWLGFVSAQSFYEAVDVVILPSIWEEPMSRILVEAVETGRPIVYARSGGLPEYGQYAPLSLSYDRFSFDALGNAMREVLRNQSKWTSPQTVTAAFSAVASEETVTRQYREVYRSALRRDAI